MRLQVAYTYPGTLAVTRITLNHMDFLQNAHREKEGSKRLKTRQKGFPNIQRPNVLICYCLLASRRSDRAKRLKQNNNNKKLQCSVVDNGGPL